MPITALKIEGKKCAPLFSQSGIGQFTPKW